MGVKSCDVLLYYGRRLNFSFIYWKDGGNDQKEIVGRLSKLRNELMTDKPILHIEDGKSDANTWNSYLDSYLEENNGVAPTWFSSPWLYVECYLYRRIQQPFNLR